MHLMKFTDIEDGFEIAQDDLRYVVPPSSALISVLRDGLWRRLPPNLLVRGDIFKLSSGAFIPCRCQRLRMSRATHQWEVIHESLPSSTQENHKTASDPEHAIPEKSVMTMKNAVGITGRPRAHDESVTSPNTSDAYPPARSPTEENRIMSQTINDARSALARNDGRKYCSSESPKLAVQSEEVSPNSRGSVPGTDPVEYQPGEVYRHPRYNLGSPKVSYFVALDCPGVDQVKQFLKFGERSWKQKQNTAFFQLMQLVLQRMMWIFLVFFILCIFAVATWYFIKLKETQATLGMRALSRLRMEMMIAPLRICFCFGPMIPQLLYQFSDIWGNARIQSMVDVFAGEMAAKRCRELYCCITFLRYGFSRL